MLNRYSPDWGLLILRVGIGAAFIMHGWPKISGGPAMWLQVGEAMKSIHITFGYTFWGFMAALAEFGGGICLVLGFLFRPALAMMIFTMFIATWMIHTNGGGYNDCSRTLEDGIIFIALFVASPGKFALKIVQR